MRRPPVLLIIVAVLLTGVSVGWAASSNRDSLELTAVRDAPDDPVEILTAPELSSETNEAVAVGDDEASTGVAREVEPSAPKAAPIIGTEAPNHLDEKTAPLVVEPIQVVPTTSAPPVEAPSAPKPSVAFSATQAYGFCEEPIPYDIFSGTAEPGSDVTISSPYGGGSAVADGSGHWEHKVEFPDAPRGTTFAVKASGLGGSKTFNFTALPAEH